MMPHDVSEILKKAAATPLSEKDPLRRQRMVDRAIVIAKHRYPHLFKVTEFHDDQTDKDGGAQRAGVADR